MKSSPTHIHKRPPITRKPRGWTDLVISGGIRPKKGK